MFPFIVLEKAGLSNRTANLTVKVEGTGDASMVRNIISDGLAAAA